MTEGIYTIGHSTHTIEKFIELLKSRSITAVCDVRSRPYSRMNPQFNREPLKQALRAANIKYVFLGKELGARSEDKSCYRNGQVQYDLLAQTDKFKQGIERVREGARFYRVALMCAEKEPLECHRAILVSRKLFEEDLPIKHILGDGRLEEHEHTLERLISKLKIPEGDMFRSHDATIDEAYMRQGIEIAYREQVAQTPASERQPTKVFPRAAK
jgi:uncharacterized protein (DUF488 family)